MATATLPPEVSTAPPRLASLIARAIVHLNFNEPDKAQRVLCDALTDINFPPVKENTDGNRPAAA